MSTFAIYNYEFDINLSEKREQDLFSGKTNAQIAHENFDKRQQLLADIFQEDYNGKLTIPFLKRGNPKTPYIRKWITEPREDMYVFRLINDRKHKVHDFDEKLHDIDDYLGCYIIIDNKPGHQVLAIEDKTTAIGSLSTTANVVKNAINSVLKQYFLEVRLENIYDPSTFWDLVNNKQKFPNGIREVVFNFPRRNLARLSDIQGKLQFLVDESRKEWDSEVSIHFKKDVSKQGPLQFNKSNPVQNSYVDVSSAMGGAKSAVLYPASSEKAVHVGRGNNILVKIPDETLKNLKEGNKEIFEDPLDEIMAILRDSVKNLPDENSK